ncbi:MAG: protein translocase subunit SecD [Kiritimatiellia bacterium]|jgi:SecD/SecF fusion protein
MNKNYTLLKWLIFAALVFFSIVIVWPPKEKIRLGLDLAGGTSFTLEVDEAALRQSVSNRLGAASQKQIDDAVAEELRLSDERAVEVIRNRIDALGVNEPEIVSIPSLHRVQVKLPGANSNQVALAEASIADATVSLDFRMVKKDSDDLVQKNIFRNNTPPEGYRCSTLSDGRSCLVRIESDETDSAGNVIPSYNTLIRDDPDYPNRVALHGAPARYSLLLQHNRDTDTYEPLYVKNSPEKVTGKMVHRAKVEQNPMTGDISISLSFDDDGKKAFRLLTEKYARYGRDGQGPNPKNPDGTPWRLAIVMREQVYSAPVINTPIPDGNAQITGSFTYQEAARLANVLNAGALDVPLTILEKSTVDPSLGEASIRSGLRASLLAGIVVVLFMLVYYRFLGVIASFALLMDIVLLPVGMLLAGGILGAFSREVASAGGRIALPVLTMPGIAGIVLSLGMAVDANVLIFERMREEFAAGKSAATAVANGFKGAASAIADSNLTTILTGIILFCLGSGPVRGFAVTLVAGIIVSMYTALVLTRMILDASVSKSRVKPYSMMKVIAAPKFDFIGAKRPAFLFATALIVLTMGVTLYKGITNPTSIFTVDFVGGTTVTLDLAPSRADAKPSKERVEETLKVAFKDVRAQYSQGFGGQGETLTVTTSDSRDTNVSASEGTIGPRVADALNSSFPDANFTVKGEEMIGPTVGAALKVSAMRAIVLAWIGIILYVTIRFEFGFAVGAVAALVHDVLVTVGIYCVLGRQISLTTVAALLTIVGYSVNDTIVIFDRVRSDLKLDQRTPFPEICNRALSQTLNRTIMTSGTTIMAVLLLLIFGGASIFDFALCLIIGMVAGVFSTLFLASPIMLACYRGRRPAFITKKQ